MHSLIGWAGGRCRAYQGQVAAGLASGEESIAAREFHDKTIAPSYDTDVVGEALPGVISKSFANLTIRRILLICLLIFF